jgi:hypothetical protein
VTGDGHLVPTSLGTASVLKASASLPFLKYHANNQGYVASLGNTVSDFLQRGGVLNKAKYNNGRFR